MQQFEALRRYLDVQRDYARNVAARSVEAGDESDLNWVGGDSEDDRHRGARSLCRQCRGCAAGHGNHADRAGTDRLPTPRKQQDASAKVFAPLSGGQESWPKEQSLNCNLNDISVRSFILTGAPY